MADDRDEAVPERGRRTLSDRDLKWVAIYQKGILLCILISIGMVAGQFFIPGGFQIFLIVGFLAVGVTSAVFMFLLSTKLYPGATGILLAILTLVPYLGIVALLIVNGKATSVLQKNGYHVGLLGVDLDEFPS